MLKPKEKNEILPASIADIDALIATSTSPQFVERCKVFRDQFRKGDEILEFCTSIASWQDLAGRKGYLLRRNGKDIAIIITMLN